MLAQLVEQSSIQRVYCLVRPKSPEKSSDRLLNAQNTQGLQISETFARKVIALDSNLREKDLGLGTSALDEIRKHVSLIIHCAWDVNFTIGLRSFEEYHFKGLQNLLNLSLSVKRPRPARFIFCSSVSVALATPKPAIIAETVLKSLDYAANMGYAKSKLIGEHIVYDASIRAGALSRVVRLGQIVGDKKTGLWNEHEATPLMIRSALYLKALPAMDESCSWIPVDTAAATILDLGGVSEPEIPVRREAHHSLVYNVMNPRTFSWTSDLLPALRAAGLEFDTVTFTDWLARLKTIDQDPQRNPIAKLISFWEKQDWENDRSQGDPIFETRYTEEDSEALRKVPHILADGYVERFVQNWVKRWV